jgi:hypothetical protein
MNTSTRTPETLVFWVVDGCVIEAIENVLPWRGFKELNRRYLKQRKDIPFEDYQGLFQLKGSEFTTIHMCNKQLVAKVRKAQAIAEQASCSFTEYSGEEYFLFGEKSALERSLYHLQYDFKLHNGADDPRVGGTILLLKLEKEHLEKEALTPLLYDEAILALTNKRARSDTRLRDGLIDSLMEVFARPLDRVALLNSRIGVIGSCKTVGHELSYAVEIHRPYTTGGSRLVRVAGRLSSPSNARKFADALVEEGTITSYLSCF